MTTRPVHPEIIPNSDNAERLDLTGEIVSTYGLDRWAKEFSLMTAGYRDHVDPRDAWSPDVPFNIVTVAIMAEAKGRVMAFVSTCVAMYRRARSGIRHLGCSMRDTRAVTISPPVIPRISNSAGRCSIAK